MVNPCATQPAFDRADCLLEIVGKIGPIKHQNSPSGRFESLIAAPVAKDLAIQQMMSAVVLDGDPTVTIAEVGCRRHGITDP